MTKIKQNITPVADKSQVFSKIPAYFPTDNKKLLRAYICFATLKQFKFNGSLHDFNHNIKAYAAQLSVHPNTLRARVKEMLYFGFVRYNGKTLQLYSYKRVFNLIIPKKVVKRDGGYDLIQPKRFYKFTGTFIKTAELFAYKIAIKENYRRQQHAVNKKLITYERENLKACHQYGLFTNDQLAVMVKRASQRTGERAFEKYAKLFMKNGYDAAVKRQERVYYETLSGSVDLPPINVVVTLSCSGIARVCLGSTNRSTGWYLQRVLMANGMVEAKNVSVRAKERLKTMQAFYEPFGFYQRGKSMFRTLTSQMTPT